MLIEYEKVYHQVEEKHWWHDSRRDYISKIIQKISFDSSCKILDIGCSTGVLIEKLSKLTNAEIFGIDVSDNAINACRDRGLVNTKVMNGEKLDYENSTFDIVIASDCLEHIEDDRKALKEWYRVLKNRGKIIIFVPAFMSIWTELDQISKHYRRYGRNELKLKLKNSRFIINRISFWNCMLFIPIFLTRFLYPILQTKMKYSLGQLPNPIINRLLFSILKIENNILMKTNLPIGVSLFAICEKR